MPETNNRGKWQLFFMLAIVAGVLIAGYLVFPKTPEQREALLEKLGTTNHGQLLSTPASFDALPLTTMQNRPWLFTEQKLKWRMLILGDENCTDECEELLYITRQVHLRLGIHAHRLERIYLTTASQVNDQFTAKIEREHPYLKVLKTDRPILDGWLDKMAVPGHPFVLLVDQNGLAMMLYTSEHTGSGMLEDLTHLLKYSPAQ